MPTTINPRHRNSLEKVLGKDLKVDDFVWIEGYLWVIDSIIHEPNFSEKGRYCLNCHWSGIDTDPNFFNDDFCAGLRADLEWTRVRAEIAAQLQPRNFNRK